MTTDTEINSIKTGVSGSSPVLDCDFHTHTGFSDDCDVSADEMCIRDRPETVPPDLRIPGTT